MKCGAAKLVAVAGVLGTALLPRPAAAELHAIVAGFNDYSGGARLRGAVADATDIATVLERRGVHDVVKLTDGSTTVAIFKDRFADIVARANAGDVILFAFSGHGIRVPETREPKRTPDGYDKGFLFPTYDQARHPDEILRDEDLYDLFQSTAAKGLHVLFVVDACHAGTGLRTVNPRHGGGAPKYQQFDLRPGTPPVVPPKQTVAPRPPIPGVAAITAQLAEKTVLELQIGGQMRGVLSFAVARGLEGGSDPNRTGTITLDMLWQYVRQVVRVQSENQQAPTLFAREVDGALPILQSGNTISATPPPQPGLPQPGTIGVFVIGSPALPSLRGGIFISDRARADLIWDAGRKQILNAPGDVLASDINPSSLQDTIDARRLLLFLRKTAETAGGLDVKVTGENTPLGSSDDRIYQDGEPVRFETASGPYPYLTAFDINSNGTVQFIYPQPSDPAETNSPSPWGPTRVRKPFGADFAVFIRSDEPLSELDAAFARAPQQEITASQVYDMVRRALRGTRFRVGIQGFYTCRRIMENGQCDSMLASP